MLGRTSSFSEWYKIDGRLKCYISGLFHFIMQFPSADSCEFFLRFLTRGSFTLETKYFGSKINNPFIVVNFFSFLRSVWFSLKFSSPIIPRAWFARTLTRGLPFPTLRKGSKILSSSKVRKSFSSKHLAYRWSSICCILRLLNLQW